ncbi:hypothetical protein DSS36_23880 [Salmonella enterica subsp. enterica serovar Newport]|nr:hypothetical protein [Salmonella enterica subsp. enterica serovar Newport]EBS3869540.1 hypothetical protein [Salmonella enterica subsp. enterica serovar Kimberley]ECL1759202.1 hypothetical protein [Salmonella enterica]EDL3630208.1 hypothetical protein [Salmonella enterica subsp. enterica serovar Newport]EEE9161392.1 hypothetical protein [Salmonella enterica subsp. enterica serovar Kimberley]
MNNDKPEGPEIKRQRMDPAYQAGYDAALAFIYRYPAFFGQQNLSVLPSSPSEQGKYLKEIMDILANDSQEKVIPDWFIGSNTDREFLSALVAVANNKKGSNRNIIVCEDIQALPWYINSYCGDPLGCPILLRITSKAAHVACVYYYKDITDKISFFIFETAHLSEISKKIEEILCREFNNENLRIAIFEMDIQRSQGECAMFSLHLAKCLCDKRSIITDLHEVIWSPEGLDANSYEKSPFSHYENITILFKKSNCDKRLPPQLFKHAQSRNRLQQYISNSKYTGCPINKKGESLPERQQRFLVTTTENLVRIVSINKMRLNKYLELILELKQLYS